jgi:hypothetical protein
MKKWYILTWLLFGFSALVVFGISSVFIKWSCFIVRAEYGEKSIPWLISKLDDDEFTRNFSRAKIVSYGDEALDDLLLTLKDGDGSEAVRVQCIDCLRLIGRKSKSEKVLRTLRICSSRPMADSVRCASLSALWELEGESKKIVPGLVDLLSSPDKSVMYKAIGILDDIGPDAQEATPTLVALYESETDHTHKENILRCVNRIAKRQW